MATEDVGIDVEVRARLDRFDDQMRQAGRLVESTTKGMDRATQRLEKRFRRVEGEGQAYNRQLSAIERKIETVRRATEKGIVSNQRAAQTLDRLQKDYSNVARQAAAAASTTGRVTAAAQKSIAAQARLNGVYDRSITQLGQLAAQNRRVATDQQLVNTRLGAASRSLRTAGRSTSNFGMQAQNAAFQVGDFATQIASGQSATRALAQQLPQLLGGFGLIGAAIGAVVAVGGALAPMLLNIGDNAENAAKSNKTYKDSLDAVEKITKRVNDQSLTRVQRLKQEGEAALEGAEAELEAARARLKATAIKNQQDLPGAGRRKRIQEQQVEAAEDLEEAFKRVQDLRERLNRTYEKAREQEEDATDATESNTDATNGNTEAQRRNLDTRQSVLAGLREQIELEQLDERARFQRTKVMEAQNRAMERGNLLRQEQIEKIREAAGALYDARNATDDVADAQENAERATRDLGIQTQSTADIMRGAFEEVGRSIQSGIRDALLGAERDLVETAKRIAADIAAAFITQRIVIPAVVQPVAGALGLAGGAGGAAAGQGGAGGAVGQAGNALSLGSTLSNIGSGLTTPTFSASGLANFAPGIFSGGAQAAAPTAASGAITAIPAGGGTAPNALASGLSAASTPLGIGGGLIGGFAANQVFGGGIGTSAGSGLGGFAGGAALGAAFGPIGAGIGALLGSFAGGGIGSLFGSDSKPAGLLGTRLEFDEGRISGIDPRSGQKDVDPEEAQKFRESTVQAINTALGAADATANAPFDILSNVKDRQKTNLIFRNTEAGRASAAQARQALGVGGEGQTVNLSDEANDVEAVIRALLTPAVGIADNIGQDVATAVRNSTADNVEDLLSDVQFAGNFENRIEAFSQGFQKLSDSIRGQTVQNIDNFVQSIRDFNSRTEELGLSVSEAEDATASFVRKQLGIGDAIPQEQLTQFQQNQIRLGTTLEQIQNPTSDLRSLLDDLGVSADKAANAVQAQISANNQQRDARLATQFQNVFGDPTLNERITAQGLPTRLANAVRGAVTFANQNDIEAGSQVAENLGDDLIRIASQIGTDVSPALDLLNNALEGTADAANDNADAQQELADAQRDISRALEDQIGQFRQFRDEIAQTQRDLRFGSNSPLSPERRFNTLQAEFQRVSQRAQAGNEQALQRLPQVAQDFDAARTAFLGNATGRSQQVFENIQSALEGAETTADRRLDALQDQLNELNNIEGSIDSQTRQLDQWINSLPQSIANALGSVLDGLGGAGGGAGGGSARRGLDRSRSTTGSGNVSAGQEYEIGPGGGLIPASGARDSIDRRLNDVYNDVLGRDFDAAGRDFYRDRLESGTSIDRIREEIENAASGGARAMGGPVSAGSSYLVGERGPELFVPNTSGTVVSNSDTSNIGGKLDGVSQRLDAILNVLVERGEMDSEERSALVEEMRGVARETKRSRAA